MLLKKRKNIKAWNDYFAITQTTGGPETQAIVGMAKTKNAIKDTEEHFYPTIVKKFITLQLSANILFNVKIQVFVVLPRRFN